MLLIEVETWLNTNSASIIGGKGEEIRKEFRKERSDERREDIRDKITSSH